MWKRSKDRVVRSSKDCWAKEWCANLEVGMAMRGAAAGGLRKTGRLIVLEKGLDSRFVSN